MSEKLIRKARELIAKAEEAQRRGLTAKATKLLEKAAKPAKKALESDSRSFDVRTLQLDLSILLKQPRSDIRRNALHLLGTVRRDPTRALETILKRNQSHARAALAVFRWQLAYERGDMDAAWKDLVEVCKSRREDQEYIGKNWIDRAAEDPERLGKRILFATAVSDHADLSAALAAARGVGNDESRVLARSLRTVLKRGRVRDAGLLRELAEALSSLGEFPSAIDCLERAAATTASQLGDARYVKLVKHVLGATPRSVPQRSKCVALFARTRAAAGNFASARTIVAQEASRDANAASQVDTTLRRAGDPAAKALAAWVQAEAGQSESAASLFAEAATGSPEVRAPVLEMLGELIASHPGETSFATALRALSAGSPDEAVARVLDTLEKALLEQEGDLLDTPKNGMAVLQELRAIDLDRGPLLRLNARVAIAAGDTAEALGMIEQAVNDDPAMAPWVAPALDDLLAREPERLDGLRLLLCAHAAHDNADQCGQTVTSALQGGGSPTGVMEIIFDLCADGVSPSVQRSLVAALAADKRSRDFVTQGLARAAANGSVARLLRAVAEKAHMDRFAPAQVTRVLTRVHEKDVDAARREIEDAQAGSDGDPEALRASLREVPESILEPVDRAFLCCVAMYRSGRDEDAGREAWQSIEYSGARAEALADLLGRVLRRNSACATALASRGSANCELGRAEAAVSDFRKAHTLQADLTPQITPKLVSLWSGGTGVLNSGLALGEIHAWAGRSSDLATVAAQILAYHRSAAGKVAALLATPAASPDAGYRLLYEYGVALLEHGQLDAGAAALRRAYKADGADVNGVRQALEDHLASHASSRPPRMLLADILCGQRELETALDVVRDGMEHDPESVSSLIPSLIRITEYDSRSLDAWFTLADAYGRIADFPRVGETCRRIVREHPVERDRAVEFVTATLTRHKGVPDLYYLLSDIHASGQGWSAAADALTRCRTAVGSELDPVSERLEELAKASQDDVAVLEQLCSARVEAKDAEAARVVAERVYAVDQDRLRVKTIGLLRTLTEVFSKHTSAFLTLGAVFVDGRKQLEAVEAYVAAIDSDPTIVREAIQGLHSALRLRPGNGRNCFELGEAYTMTRDFKQCVSFHRRAVEASRSFLDRVVASEKASLAAFPDMTELYRSLGDLFADFKRDHEQAVQYFTDGLGHCREQEMERQLALHRGLSLQALGKREEAYSDFKRASAIKPVSREVYDTIRDFYAALLWKSATVPGKGRKRDTTACLAAAGNLIRIGEYASCLSLLQRTFAEEDQEGFPESEFLKGVAFLRNHQTDLAVASLRSCTAGVPRASELAKAARFVLGECLARLGDASGARRVLAEIYSVDAEYPQVAARMETLAAAAAQSHATEPLVLELSLHDVPIRAVGRQGPRKR